MNRFAFAPLFPASVTNLQHQAPFYQGKTIRIIAKEVVSQPPEVIERMKKLLGN
jgi:DNA-binding Lrp family transcriptional regulator